MSLWSERILGEFPPDLARFWIAADPDDVLLDEHILSELRGRGFEVLPFEDAIAFRVDYEARWRRAWDQGEPGPAPGSAKALVLHPKSSGPGDLPWDYVRQARLVRLSLANLFPLLSYGVVHRLGAEYREALFEAHAKHASQSPDQSWGGAATKDFILTHIFQLGPHLISDNVDLWRELLRLHYRRCPPRQRRRCCTRSRAFWPCGAVPSMRRWRFSCSTGWQWISGYRSASMSPGSRPAAI